MGHYAAARLHQVELAFPSVLIPSLQIGLFGSVTRFLSFPKTRQQLFDVSIAGPVAGYLGSLACLLGGLYLTAAASPDALGRRFRCQILISMFYTVTTTITLPMYISNLSHSHLSGAADGIF